MPRQRAGLSLFRGVTIALLVLVLAACGELPADTGVDTGVEVTPPVPLSPTAGEIPEETNLATASIEDGALDPDRFGGQIGTAFEIEITGDGTEHTLAIGDLVAATPIAAEGATTVAFTIEGEPGEAEITLDGNPAGVFELQSAAGITDS